MMVIVGDVLVMLVESDDVLLKQEIKDVFKEIEYFDEGLEKEYLIGICFKVIYFYFMKYKLYVFWIVYVLIG